jgi:hypothetical protein
LTNPLEGFEIGVLEQQHIRPTARLKTSNSIPPALYVRSLPSGPNLARCCREGSCGRIRVEWLAAPGSLVLAFGQRRRRVDWSNWESGDCIYAPDLETPPLEQAEVLRRIATGFRRVVIDWPEGDRYVDARLARAIDVGYSGALLEAERNLRGRTVLVSVAEESGPDATWLKFLMPSDDGYVEMMALHYEPLNATFAGRALADKLAALLGYQFETADEGELEEPDATADHEDR